MFYLVSVYILARCVKLMCSKVLNSSFIKEIGRTYKGCNSIQQHKNYNTTHYINTQQTSLKSTFLLLWWICFSIFNSFMPEWPAEIFACKPPDKLWSTLYIGWESRKNKNKLKSLTRAPTPQIPLNVVSLTVLSLAWKLTIHSLTVKPKRDTLDTNNSTQ